MTKIHQFDDSLKFGKFVEEAFDDLFAPYFDIETVSLREEKARGIGSAVNNGYVTKGLCVPIPAIEGAAFPFLRRPMDEIVVVKGKWDRPW